jgi:hypothetical protein
MTAKRMSKARYAKACVADRPRHAPLGVDDFWPKTALLLKTVSESDEVGLADRNLEGMKIRGCQSRACRETSGVSLSVSAKPLMISG